MGKGFLQSLSDALGARTTRWDFLKRPEFGFPTDRPITGPTKPRPPTPGLHFPPGTHIPDWRSYKVEGHPHLEEVQRRLAARGLKDPWLRNEVWRYQFREWGNPKFQFQRWIFPSMAYGFAMFLVVLICEETIFKKKDGHGHGH